MKMKQPATFDGFIHLGRPSLIQHNPDGSVIVHIRPSGGKSIYYSAQFIQTSTEDFRTASPAFLDKIIADATTCIVMREGP